MSLGGTFVIDERMNTILYSRYVSAKLRRKGSAKSFDNVIDKHFLISLEKILSNYKGIFKFISNTNYDTEMELWGTEFPKKLLNRFGRHPIL